MKVLDFDGLKLIVKKIKELLDLKVDKVEGKALSTNDFTDFDKNKLDMSDIIYNGNDIYNVKFEYENGQLFMIHEERGKVIANDFYKVSVSGESFRFRIKSSSEGIILFYSLKDEQLRYAIHVYKHLRDYKIDFGKNINEEMIFTSVTMPEDEISIVREEGL